MRFHFVMLLIVIFVALGMHEMASAACAPGGCDPAASAATTGSGAPSR